MGVVDQMPESNLTFIRIAKVGDEAAGRQAATTMAEMIGFDKNAIDEIILVVSELASNIIRHAGGGTLTFSQITKSGRSGISIEALDRGPGIDDPEKVFTDGYSSAGSLGYGFGTVNRLMDEVDITSNPTASSGTLVRSIRWLRKDIPSSSPIALSFGASSRSRMYDPKNGDSFFIKSWGQQALVAVIDGLGHGEHAHKAAQAARGYLAKHYDQPLDSLFLGTGRACRGTRGVVMAIAHFDMATNKLLIGNIGNIEIRVFGPPERLKLIIRRGVLGLSDVKAKVTEHQWDPSWILIFHSDGIGTRWTDADYPNMAEEAAEKISLQLLRDHAKVEDDATVIVIKGKIEQS